MTRLGCGRREDELGRLLADHDGGRVGVAADDHGHDRCIGDPEPGDAVDPEPFVHHRHRVRAHAAGANGMEGRHRVGTEPRRELFVALQVVTGRQLAAAIGVEGRLRDDVADHANARNGRPAIGFVLQIVGLDQRRRGRIGRAQPDPAPALGNDRADTQGEAVGLLHRRLLERTRDVEVRRALQRRHEVHLNVRRQQVRPGLE